MSPRRADSEDCCVINAEIVYISEILSLPKLRQTKTTTTLSHAGRKREGGGVGHLNRVKL